MTDVQPTAQQLAEFERHFFRRDFVEKHGAAPVSWRRLDKALAHLRMSILDGAAEGLADQLATLIKPMLKRMAELEQTVAALQKAEEKTLADVYRGVFMPGTAFKRGELCTWQGSLWLALVDTEQKPGATADWKMVTKRGADGKDLRP